MTVKLKICMVSKSCKSGPALPLCLCACVRVCAMLCLASGNIKISVETSKVNPTPKRTKEHKRYLSRLVWKICFRCTTAGPNVNYEY